MWATETILIHEKILKNSCNKILKVLEDNGCKIIGDTKIRNFIVEKYLKLQSKIGLQNIWHLQFLSNQLKI